MAATPNNDSAKPATEPKPRFGKDQPKHYCGKKGRSGPKAGNTNAIRHGLKAGKLPKNAQYIEHQVNRLRRELEAAVFNVKGEVSLLDAATIQTALKWERHGALALRWLRVQSEKLKPTEALQFSREIARASTERDRALRALGLDAPPKPVTLGEYIAGKHNGDDEGGQDEA